MKQTLPIRHTQLKTIQWLLTGAGDLPIIVPAALAAFSTVAVIFLLIGQFRGVLVWPFGLVAAVVVAVVIMRLTRRLKYPGSVKERIVCDILLLVGVIFWVGFNALYTPQHVFVNRDPGFYAVTGGWLIDHDNLRINTVNVFGNAPGVESASAGFAVDPRNSSQLDAQGLHLLPALLGLAGQILGPNRMLRINVLFGGTALLAMYAFARLVVKPRWALVVVTALALCLPLLYFSRDTYTEPLAMTFTFGALALVWAAQTTKKYGLWFLAGMVAGAGALTRIDAYLTIAALMAFLVIFLVVSQKGDRRYRLISSILLLLGMTATSLIGWLDLSQLSNNYYVSSWAQLKPEFLLLFAIFLLGLVAVPVGWHTRLLGWLDSATKGWRQRAAIIAILLIGLGLAARPLLYTAYSTNTVQTANGATQTVAVRNYSEQTVNWVVWYIGPIVAIAGLWGLAIAAGRATKRRDLLLIAPLLVVLATSLLYLIDPKIARDQIWASRRLLPVILPGIAVFAGLGLQWLYEQKITKKLNIDAKTLTTVLATLAVIAPLSVSSPFLFTRERGQELNALASVCNSLPRNAAVLWVGTARIELVQATRSFCNKPSEGYGQDIFNSNRAKPNMQTLKVAADSARKAGLVPIIGLFGNETYLLSGKATQKDFTTVTDYTTKTLDLTYTSPPNSVITTQGSIELGLLQSNGSIVPFK